VYNVFTLNETKEVAMATEVASADTSKVVGQCTHVGPSRAAVQAAYEHPDLVLSLWVASTAAEHEQALLLKVVRVGPRLPRGDVLVLRTLDGSVVFEGRVLDVWGKPRSEYWLEVVTDPVRQAVLLASEVL
jgi:hypothetical protein